jgi:hypothetical protein
MNPTGTYTSPIYVNASKHGTQFIVGVRERIQDDYQSHLLHN